MMYEMSAKYQGEWLNLRTDHPSLQLPVGAESPVLWQYFPAVHSWQAVTLVWESAGLKVPASQGNWLEYCEPAGQ